MPNLLETLHQPKRPTLSRDYVAAFHSWFVSSGTAKSAALYEGSPTGGSSTAGGFAVPSFVDGTIIPFVGPDSSIRRLATVIPTQSDLRFPFGTATGAAALKPESGAAISNFAVASPSLGQFTLSAFQMGLQSAVSLELASDVGGLLAFLIQDAGRGLRTLEETLYLSGSGVNQPQAIFGNVGAGITGATADPNGNLLSVASTFDVLDTLKEEYHDGASWLMSASTATALRKAQNSSPSSGQPIFTRVGNQDYLHGYPVAYSAAMPAIAAGATPVLFGDFASGYLIGDRGGSEVFVKIIDQELSLTGQITYIPYRRSDGRVRDPQAIQPITLHS